jgi:3,4-dihydroxy 2-butanone 4-phosphate synthase/GTP cyclohydrolase II
MNKDGTMARLPDLVSFAQFHGLKVGTIADLIAYRYRHDHLVYKAEETVLQSQYGGEFRMMVYVNELNYAEHIALVKGDISGDQPVLVRMHALSILDDVLGCERRGKAGELQKAMEIIGEEGTGVIVLIREPHATALSERVRAQENKEPQSVDIPPNGELRDYGVGAQILLDLGVSDMTLLSNSEKNIIALEGYGLRVVGRKKINP